MEILKAAASDLDELRGTLVQAFRGDPFLDWFIPLGATHEERLAHFFGWFLKRTLKLGTVLTVPNKSAAVLLMPPGAWKLGIKEELAQLPMGIRIFGVRRLVQRVVGIAALESRMPSEPHYYIPAIGTIPPQRGRGIGSALLQAALRQAESGRAPIYLENTNELNLPFYQRSGFSIREVFKMTGSAPAMWLMLREPEAKSTQLDTRME